MWQNRVLISYLNLHLLNNILFYIFLYLKGQIDGSSNIKANKTDATRPNAMISYQCLWYNGSYIIVFCWFARQSFDSLLSSNSRFSGSQRTRTVTLYHLLKRYNYHFIRVLILNNVYSPNCYPWGNCKLLAWISYTSCSKKRLCPLLLT